MQEMSNLVPPSSTSLCQRLRMSVRGARMSTLPNFILSGRFLADAHTKLGRQSLGAVARPIRHIGSGILMEKDETSMRCGEQSSVLRTLVTVSCGSSAVDVGNCCRILNRRRSSSHGSAVAMYLHVGCEQQCTMSLIGTQLFVFAVDRGCQSAIGSIGGPSVQFTNKSKASSFEHH
ncbi:hypothetical protein VFPPC_15183 [Pochonia chlamydosporia 170]|uniref:Uncharacterized protein n=1 Tax=Pochonia chlamydosporia 170 TaxID=1380566 RepID=A0A179G4D4_METCM|nr:hypothetical protein VFPPC_15183 [Pochonia chlamydosporia 170]OAQ72712.1 hypothetical protein VFPPC_15183 [Pochonia chlamydosporia 170]